MKDSFSLELSQNPLESPRLYQSGAKCTAERSFGLVDATGHISLAAHIVISEWAWLYVDTTCIRTSWEIAGLIPFSGKQIMRYCDTVATVEAQKEKEKQTTIWLQFGDQWRRRSRRIREDYVMEQVRAEVARPDSTPDRIVALIDRLNRSYLILFCFF